MSSKMAPVLAFFLSLGVGLAYVRFGKGRLAYGSVEQPVAFNHAIHAHHPERPIECSGCHRGVEVTYHATLPTIDVCSNCHLEPKGETEKERQFIDEYVEQDKPIPWRRLFVLPDHAFFSHRLHVVRGGIECQTCHGPMDWRTSPPSRPLKVLTMNDCISCHEEQQAATDCNACHR